MLVGALTLGKATPYLANALGTYDWRSVLLFFSAVAVAGPAVNVAIAAADISTGRFELGSIPAPALDAELARLAAIDRVVTRGELVEESQRPAVTV